MATVNLTYQVQHLAALRLDVAVSNWLRLSYNDTLVYGAGDPITGVAMREIVNSLHHLMQVDDTLHSSKLDDLINDYIFGGERENELRDVVAFVGKRMYRPGTIPADHPSHL